MENLVLFNKGMSVKDTMKYLVTLYYGFLSSVNTFFIVYRLNEDKGLKSSRKYLIPVLIYGAISPFILFLFPELNNGLRYMLNFIALVLVTTTFLDHDLIKALISALLSSVTIGIGEFFLVAFYSYPLKITPDDYLRNPLHITVGSLIIFAVSFFIISLLEKKIKRVIKHILTRHYEIFVVLSLNLIAVFLILSLCLNFYTFYIKTNEISFIKEYILANTVFILIVIVLIFGSTMYLINSLISSKIKLKRNINIFSMDYLTGVLNRGAGIRFLNEQLKISRKKNMPITICYMDIDNLKEINDNYGHSEGDKLIVSIVNVIKHNIRNTDEIMRIGGDEFVIIFPNCTIDEAEHIMKRIREKINEVEFTTNDERFEAGFSYGFAEYSKGGPVDTVESLLDMADQQMYKYKRLKSQHPMYD